MHAALEQFGRIDILVNNVGGSVGTAHDPFTGDDASFEDTLTLNLTSAWWTTRAALPAMREQQHGRVISIGSGASKRAAASLAYTTAKHALVGFTRQLARATGTDGITVNLLCPGWTNTSLLELDDRNRAKAEADNVQRDACSNRRSWRGWRRSSRPTRAPGSPARSSASTAGTASEWTRRKLRAR